MDIELTPLYRNMLQAIDKGTKWTTALMTQVLLPIGRATAMAMELDPDTVDVIGPFGLRNDIQVGIANGKYMTFSPDCSSLPFRLNLIDFSKRTADKDNSIAELNRMHYAHMPIPVGTLPVQLFVDWLTGACEWKRGRPETDEEDMLFVRLSTGKSITSWRFAWLPDYPVYWRRPDGIEVPVKIMNAMPGNANQLLCRTGKWNPSYFVVTTTYMRSMDGDRHNELGGRLILLPYKNEDYFEESEW